MAASRFRSAELATAVVLLTAPVLFLVFSGADAGGAVDPTSGVLWLSALTSILLAGLVVTRIGYDLVTWLRESRTFENRTDGWILDPAFRLVELTFAGVIVAVLGFYGFLVTTQPGGRGAGAISILVVFVVVTTSSLLSITVLAHGLVDYTRFDTG